MTLMTTLSSAAVESILSSNIFSWCSICSAQDKTDLHRVVRAAERIISIPLPRLEDMYTERCKARAEKILDTEHPNNGLFQWLHSGRHL